MDDPYPVQYFRWVSQLLQGDWGWSPVLRANVFDVLVDRTPATVELTLYSLLLFIPLGLLSGALAGWRRNRASDHSFRLFAFVEPLSLPLSLAWCSYRSFTWGCTGSCRGISAWLRAWW